MASPRIPLDIPRRSARLDRRWLWWGVVVLAVGWSLYQAGIGQPGATIVNWGGRRQLAEFWSAALSPDLTPDFVRIIGRATVVTFAYAVCGTVMSVGLGFVGGVLSSRTWWRTVFPATSNRKWVGRALWLTVRGLLSVPRAIHELIWGLIFLTIFGLDPLVAVLAIAIPFGAIVSKVFSEILDETPQQPLQVLLNSGVAPATAWLYGLLPQALPNLLSYTFYRFECSLRAAAVMGVIGAGGLGYEILLSLQSLRYHELWTGFYALIVLNGAVDMWSAWVRRRMGFTSRLDINRSSSSSAAGGGPVGMRPVRTFDWKLRLSWGMTVLAIPLCFWGLGIEWQRMWAERSRSLLSDVLSDAVPTWPGWDGARYLLDLSGQTVAMSVLAICLAGIGGILLSFPAAHTFLLPGGWLRPVGQRVRWPIWEKGLLILSRLALLVSRAIPAPIWALVCLFMLFPGILPGALALAAHNFGILGRLMAEVNENLDDRPVRSLHALGASSGQVVLYGVLPQNMGRFLAYILYRWDVCMRETVIVGLVGAGGLGRLMNEQLSSFDYGGLTVTLGCFVALTFVVDMISQRMRRVIR